MRSPRRASAPRTSRSFKGQEFVSATLEASLASGRIAHAYLFSGPRGCGKTSAARILAKALNCEEGPTAKPCGECRSCLEIARGSSLDVIEIDGASNTSVDNVRQIKDEVLFPPNGGRYKVYIIDEVHMLSNSAFNALLKTIEEPPPYIVFIFATTELHKVPATIKSRCQQFAFRFFAIDALKALLAEAAAETGVEAEEEALLWIAKEAGGSPRDAYTLFDQVVSFAEGRVTAALIQDKLGLTGLDALGAMFRAAAAGDQGAALTALDGILARGVSPEQLVSEATEYCRAMLLIKCGIEKASLLGSQSRPTTKRPSAAFTAERLERALAGLLDLYRNLRYTVDPRFELELAVARLCRLADYVSPAELAAAVASLKRVIAGDAALPPALAKGEPRSPSAEKKKPELPPRLSAAFESLAATAEQSLTAAEQSPGVAEAPGSRTAPASSPRPFVMNDAAEEDEEPAEQGASGNQGGLEDTLRASVIAELGRSSPVLKTGAGLLPALEDRGLEARDSLPLGHG